MLNKKDNGARVMVTIKEVAKEAGVSISLVSKALNGYEGVKEETRKHIEDVAKRLQYVPNVFASNLSRKNSHNIALVIQTFDEQSFIDEINMSYISGAYEQANKIGYETTILFDSVFKDNDVNHNINFLKSKGIDSIIIFWLNQYDTFLTELIAADQFLMTILDVPFYNEKVSSISIDNEEAQYKIAELAIKTHSPQRILYLSGPKDSYIGGERIKGIDRIKIAHPNLVISKVEGHFSEVIAKDLTTELMFDYDLIICASDMMAIGALHAVDNAKSNLPVIGFDGIKFLEMSFPGTMTYKQDFRKKAEVAVNEIKNLYDGKPGQTITM